MSQFIKFYFTSSILNIFRILIHPSSGAIISLITSDIKLVSYSLTKIFVSRLKWFKMLRNLIQYIDIILSVHASPLA